VTAATDSSSSHVNEHHPSSKASKGTGVPSGHTVQAAMVLDPAMVGANVGKMD